jgi:hypothetical protein
MTGKWADLWMDMARTHLLRLLSLNPVPVSQDGGRIDSNLAIRCSDAEWKTLKRELFFDTEVIGIHSTSDQPARQEVAQ